MKCFKCNLDFSSIINLISHFKKIENIQEQTKNFFITCPDDLCDRKFTSFNGLKVHFQKIHETKEDSVSYAPPPKKICFDAELSKSFNEISDEVEKEIEDFFTNLCVFSIPEEQQNVIANYLSSLVTSIKDLAIASVAEDEIKPVEAINIAFKSAKDLIYKFDSKHKRKVFFSHAKLYVAPEEKSISTRIESTYNSNLGIDIDRAVQSTFQFVSMKKTLQTLFTINSFRTAYFDSKHHTCTPGVYQNICCGSNVSENEFFKKNPNAVQIELYYDEVEPCDALKQSAGVHKLGQFYYRIKNLDPSIQSQWNNIFLLASFYFIDLEGDVNINNILTHIREEICFLEEIGIEVEGYGLIKATIVSTVHDNLGAHMIFRMVLGFNSRYFCRFCKITLDESKQATKVDFSLIRSNIKEELENEISNLDAHQQLDHHKSFGFKGFSELHHLKYFKMEDNSSVDPLHDLLEGVNPRDLLLVFKYMTKNMHVDERDIKLRINNFKYGSINNSHKPVNIKLNSESSSIGLSAMQVKTLIINFPFIFGHLFSTDEELMVLQFVCDLIKITNISLKHVVTENEVVVLENLIEKHLGEVIGFFNSTLTRKHHFLLHYPSIIRRLGPTGLMSTAPYEHKHIFFTRLIRKTSINKNVIKTIAIRHQSVMSIESDDRFSHKISLGKVTEASEVEFDTWTTEFRLPKTHIDKVSWIKYGHRYTSSYFIHYNQRPIEIVQIIKQTDKFYIIGNNYDYSNDEKTCSFTLNHITHPVIIDFEEVKLSPPFNKILSSTDNKYHIYAP